MELLDLQFFDLHSTASFAASLAPRSALVLPLAVAGLLTVLVAAYIAVKRAAGNSTQRLRNLSPEKITSYHEAEENPSPEKICASIIERATQIKAALDEKPSDIEVEMCALGYRKCANDMITLTHIVNEETEGAPLIRRWRLARCRKRAIESLSAVRESLPPEVLKASRQEKQ